MPKPIEDNFAQNVYSAARYFETLQEWFSTSPHASAYTRSTLGVVDGQPIVLLRPTAPIEGPNLIVGATFHGEEPAGAWGVMTYLFQELGAAPPANISFLPLVNPTGLNRGTRHNVFGENPNAGWIRTGTTSPETSAEAKAILANIDLIADLGQDGVLSLHEDWEQARGYLYAYEQAGASPAWREGLLAVIAEAFGVADAAEAPYAPLDNGVALNHRDGSFEDFMFENGAKRAYCTETPGLRDLPSRIRANCLLIKAFVASATDSKGLGHAER